jgi:transcriptional regulator with XRE-family HTH domain
MYSDADVDLLRRAVWMRAEKGLNPAALRSVLTQQNGSDAKAPPASADGSQAIGRKLRLLRRRMRLTLDKVAGEIGITGSALSTFERTSQGISFKTLHDLAHYFGTTLSALSGEQTSGRRALVRAGHWRQWPQTMPGVTIQMLAEGANQMDCHRFVLAPGASSEGAYRHEGEEFMHLISGRLEVVLDQAEIHDLRAGDSLYFESRRRHAWTNRHDGETVILWINTPPTF